MELNFLMVLLLKFLFLVEELCKNNSHLVVELKVKRLSNLSGQPFLC
jgi:hypothetical protein